MTHNSQSIRVMECRGHLKNAASPKSQTIRKNFLVVAVLMLLAIVMAGSVRAQIIVPENANPPKKKNQIPYYEYLLDFQNDLEQRGFTKQITLWDLVPPIGPRSQAAYLNGGDYAQIVRHLVGIWINYQDELVMFRTNGNVLDEGKVVPFDQITEARVKVDAYEETNAQGKANTSFGSNRTSGRTSAKTVTQEIVKSAEVTVVTKSAKGVQNYRIFISNFDASMNPMIGALAKAHDSKNDKAVPFVQNIADEIDFIINEYKKSKN